MLFIRDRWFSVGTKGQQHFVLRSFRQKKVLIPLAWHVLGRMLASACQRPCEVQTGDGGVARRPKMWGTGGLMAFGQNSAKTFGNPPRLWNLWCPTAVVLLKGGPAQSGVSHDSVEVSQGVRSWF